MWLASWKLLHRTYTKATVASFNRYVTEKIRLRVLTGKNHGHGGTGPLVISHQGSVLSA